MVAATLDYARIALDDPDGLWELHAGVLRGKPTMSYGHNGAMRRLAYALTTQLDPDVYEVSSNASRVRQTEANYYIPDLMVIPVAMMATYHDRQRALEVYDEPLPLVIEVWSPSTGDYDIDAKLPPYQRRGDREIWRVHPFDRTVTSWVRMADGTYAETVHTGGVVRPVALPDVAIDLDVVFRVFT